jgi:hypothetical protein
MYAYRNNFDALTRIWTLTFGNGASNIRVVFGQWPLTPTLQYLHPFQQPPKSNFSLDESIGLEKLIFLYRFYSITRVVRHWRLNHWVWRRANLIIFIYCIKSKRPILKLYKCTVNRRVWQISSRKSVLMQCLRWGRMASCFFSKSPETIPLPFNSHKIIPPPFL